MIVAERVEKPARACVEGEPEEAAMLAQQALDQGMDPLRCINEGLTLSISWVGASA